MEAKGSSSSSSSSKKFQQQAALKELEEAIDRIDGHEKAAYLEAVRRAPHLVATESDPKRFLRFTNFNTVAAAQAIVLYWKRRCEVFGGADEDRAFLPLTLTGNGAMTKEAIESLKSSQWTLLPHNRHGRAVICCDQSRRLETHRETRRQAVFYWAQVLSEDEASQGVGYDFLTPVHEMDKFDLVSLENITLALTAFPIKSHCWHIFNCVPEWIEDSRAGNIEKYLRSIYGPVFSGLNVLFHDSKRKKKGIVEKLEALGFERKGIPSSLGGSWSYERFAEWLEERGRRDEKIEEFFSHSVNTRGTNVAWWEDGHGTMEAFISRSIKNNFRHDSPNGKEDKNSSRPLKKRAKKETALFILQWHCQVDKAIGMLPREYTFAYEQAVANVPAEVYKMGIDLFLQTEDFNPFLSAHRIARYWRLRAESFGPRKYLPMHQTGDGALGNEDLQMLGMNFLNILPNDNKGCPVMWYDDSRLLKESKKTTTETKNRCLFYMFSLLAENENSRLEGAVLLQKLNSPPFPFARIDTEWMKRLVYALPLRFKAVHLLLYSSISTEDQAKLDFGDNIYVHIADTMSEVSTKIQSFGIEKAGLPKSLDGEWDRAKFLFWQEVRARMEWQIPQTFGRKVPPIHALPSIKPYMMLPDTEKAERSRRLNKIHCRRKRDKRRLAAEALQDQILELECEQSNLKKENRKLGDLLASATDMVSAGEALAGLTVATNPTNGPGNRHPPSHSGGKRTGPKDISRCDLQDHDCVEGGNHVSERMWPMHQSSALNSSPTFLQETSLHSLPWESSTQSRDQEIHRLLLQIASNNSLDQQIERLLDGQENTTLSQLRTGTSLELHESHQDLVRGLQLVTSSTFFHHAADLVAQPDNVAPILGVQPSLVGWDPAQVQLQSLFPGLNANSQFSLLRAALAEGVQRSTSRSRNDDLTESFLRHPAQMSNRNCLGFP